MNNKNPNTSNACGRRVARVQYDNIYLGLGLQKSIVLTRIIDGGTPEKAKRLVWDRLWDFVADQQRQARKVHAVYEADALGFWPWVSSRDGGRLLG